jgi:DNA mismatch endonuclease (patch repair protein)
MQGNRASGTTPERVLARQLRVMGLTASRYRDLPGRPDFVFTAAKVAIFCDGDFWHGRDWKELRRLLGQRANSAYWVAKIAYNIRRDVANGRTLKRLGWKVLRVWERDIMRDPVRIARLVQKVVAARQVIRHSARSGRTTWGAPKTRDSKRRRHS